MTAIKPLLAAFTIALGAAGALAAQAPRPSPAPRILSSTYGADLYQFYCSNCHGVTAHGGPARSVQHLPPPDLTVLTRSNNGIFPRDRVRSTITFGAPVAGESAHGTADMPVWGAVFRSLDASDTLTAIRIENLVKYLESLQEAPGGH